MHNWVYVPVGLVRDPALPPEAKVTYLVLASFCSRANRRCSPTREELMKMVGVRSPTSMRSYLRMLAERGWLEFEYVRRTRRTVFILHDVELDRIRRDLDLIRRRLDRAEFKGEAIMKEWLTLTVDSDDYTDNARPGFLVNPLTGERMEYDRWYTCGVAFEFNGPQHSGPTEAYPDTDKARQTMARDLMKRGLSEQHEVKLVTIRPEDLSYTGIRRKGEGLLPLRDIPEDDPRVVFLNEVSALYLRKSVKHG
ncbi:MAG: ArsR family transcriptional regulator [Bacillota bacterium]